MEVVEITVSVPCGPCVFLLTHDKLPLSQESDTFAIIISPDILQEQAIKGELPDCEVVNYHIQHLRQQEQQFCKQLEQLQLHYTTELEDICDHVYEHTYLL